MRCMILCALAASAAMGVSTTALAQEGQMHIRLDGVDRHTAAGAREALSRIHRASAAFCEVDEGRVGLARQQQTQTCYRTMNAKAVSRLDEPRVTALYEGRDFPSPAFEAAPVLAQR